MKSPKIVLYTALFGNYSGLIEQPKLENVDFLCYTDQDISSDSWKIIKVPPPIQGNNTKSSRYYKILPHKHLQNYDISIFIDANFVILKDFTPMVLEKLKNNTIVCFDHNQTILDPRDCIYDEYDELIRLATENRVFRDSVEVMKEQINFIKKEGYPKNNGLITSGVLIRKHNDKKLIELMELWWNFVKNRSKRDQLSFNYAVWKLNFKDLSYLNGDIRRGNPWFYWIPHKKDFSKDLKKLKKKRFIEKYYPNVLNPEKSFFLQKLIYHVNLPVLLAKLNKWTKRYSLEKLSKQEIKELRLEIVRKKLNKIEIIEEIKTLNWANEKIRLSYWNSFIENKLTEKHKNQAIRIAKNPTVTATIVEARKHPHFKTVVQNVLSNLEHFEVGLNVYHGTENEAFVKDCLKDYNNIRYINLQVKNLDIEAYNKIMLSKEFHREIPTDKFLVFQTDTISFKPLDQEFLNYDYIGAPWRKENHDHYGAQVGNGGLSLRSKTAMLTILEQNIPREENDPEDLYLSRILTQQQFNIAPYEVALQFATEDVYTENTFGCHKSWELIRLEQLKKILNQAL